MSLIRRLLCRHRWRWASNIHGDAINHHGGNRSVWACYRCGADQTRPTMMPDLDALIARIDAAGNGELIPIGPNAPDLCAIRDAITDRFYEPLP